MAERPHKAQVYLNNKRAGLLERAGNRYRFTYYPDYLLEPNAYPVSLTLSLRHEPYESETLFPFFLGLIPEGWLLELTSRTLKIDPENAFDILLANGGDCVGAVTVIAEDKGDGP